MQAACKRCPSCKAEKSTNCFNVSNARHDGLQPYCKLCQRKKCKRTPAQWRLMTYGLEASDFEDMWKRQAGLCAICSSDLSIKVAVDHNHTTGKVRGLLCYQCNTGIGLLKDDPMVLIAAASYLQERGSYGQKQA